LTQAHELLRVLFKEGVDLIEDLIQASDGRGFPSDSDAAFAPKQHTLYPQASWLKSLSAGELA
jgi:hypothetical protein